MKAAIAKFFRRRKRLVSARTQLKLVGSFFCLSAIALMLQVLVLGHFLTEAALQMPSGGRYLMDSIPDLLARSLLLSVAFLIPPVLILGIFRTFQICGPLERFERYLRSIAQGDHPVPCRIRKTDELQGMCELLNAAVYRLQAAAQEARDAQDSRGTERDDTAHAA